MAEELKIVISADARPMRSSLHDLRDRMAIVAAHTAQERHAALERMHRRHLLGAADVFLARAQARRWYDPRGHLDAWHATAALALIESSRAAEESA